MNVGERDELLSIFKLIQIRQKYSFFNGSTIISVKCGGVECKPLPMNLNSINMLNDDDLSKFAESQGVSIAPKGAKADIEVNGIGYSIKSNHSAPPALVNHTARPGFENVCLRIGSDISKLDILIKEYWNFRKGGYIAEDVKNSDPISPFRKHKEFLRPILNYFLFTGTGQKDSYFPAKHILKFTDPLDQATWKIYDSSNALDLMWDKLVFSLRAKKGMPSGYPNNMSKKALLLKDSVDLWTEFIDGDYRGALHIRSLK